MTNAMEAGSAVDFYFPVVDASTTQRFFTTSKGHMGVESKLAKAGDVVGVVQGAKMPWILRPHEDHFTMLWVC